MGYYNIYISPQIKYMTHIDTKLVKFGYNTLPIGICTSSGIFKAKLYKTLGDN